MTTNSLIWKEGIWDKKDIKCIRIHILFCASEVEAQSSTLIITYILYIIYNIYVMYIVFIYGRVEVNMLRVSHLRTDLQTDLRTDGRTFRRKKWIIETVSLFKRNANPDERAGFCKLQVKTGKCNRSIRK